MIATSKLSFQYNHSTAFSFPDITVREGETLLVTGNSGKGKTTLLHILGGLLRPKNGTVKIGETAIENLSESKLDKFRGNNIGLVLQQSYFVESLNVLENVVLASWLAKGKKATENAKKLLEQLSLSDQIYKSPTQLSVGQQQRVSIARALINSPKLVLADEPTSSLDDENTAVVANLLSSMATELGAALIIVTHDQRLKQLYPNTISL
ncbi:MAG TPA: ATP-binding cassette domain-containing protein [Flavobacterium sp.]|jgi:putative ABC transport system ATP-binding protein